MILIATHIEQDNPEPWMLQPLPVQEVEVDLHGIVRLRAEAPDGTPTLIGGLKCDTVDGSLPASWTCSQQTEEVLIFGPSAWQQQGFWDRYADGDEAAHELYEQFRTASNS